VIRGDMIKDDKIKDDMVRAPRELQVPCAQEAMTGVAGPSATSIRI
jgi:hypothetical protein